MSMADPRASQQRDFDLTSLGTVHLLLAAIGICAVLWVLVLLTILR